MRRTRRTRASSPSKTPGELYSSLTPSIVTITTRKGSTQVGATGGGTGFLIDDAGTIATTHRVIEGAGHAQVRMQNGARFDVVDLLADDAGSDLALLRIDLLQLAAGVQVWTMARSVLPAQDSVKFVAFARSASERGWPATMTDRNDAPVFPALRAGWAMARL